MKLLLRLYEPTEGEIRYGGRGPARHGPRRPARAHRRGVPGLRALPVHRGREHRPRRRPALVEDRAAHRARRPRRGGAAALVEALPQGYDTVLGGWFEAGQELSAGQWQKLAVARAFMREDAEVLDPRRAHRQHRRRGRARAVRALPGSSRRTGPRSSSRHRFSTVRMADRIAVLHGGQLEELGTHRELMARGRALRPPLPAAGAGLPGLAVHEAQCVGWRRGRAGRAAETRCGRTGRPVMGRREPPSHVTGREGSTP